MTEKLKATELFHFYYCLLMEHGGDLSEEITVSVVAIKSAVKACEEIIEAIEITTGHCTLRLLERQEVAMDFEYWKRVVIELKKM